MRHTQYAKIGFEQRKTWTLISNGVIKDMVENQLNGNLEKGKEAEQMFLEEKAGN